MKKWEEVFNEIKELSNDEREKLLDKISYLESTMKKPRCVACKEIVEEFALGRLCYNCIEKTVVDTISKKNVEDKKCDKCGKVVDYRVYVENGGVCNRWKCRKIERLSRGE
jgi:hypothetical protein